MAVYFFDSSAIFKRYVTEPGTGWVVGITDPAAGHSIYLATITGVEDLAMTLAETHGLRGYDAVQLAAGVELNRLGKSAGLPPLTLVSGDRQLNSAASIEGLLVEDPTVHP